MPETGCVCPANLTGLQYCQRHGFRKSEHERRQCRTRPDFFALWETGESPAQRRGVPPPETVREMAIGDRRFVVRERSSGNPGGRAWPAGRLLAAQVFEAAAAGVLKPGETTLDLGCGTGIVGLAALAAGLRVTFADACRECLENAAHNARANGFPDEAFELLLVDWRAAESGGERTWRHVLASDVLYDHRQNAALVDWLARHWAPDQGGQCWLTDPARPGAETFRAALGGGFRRTTRAGIDLYQLEATPAPELGTAHV